ncbi:MAG: twitch domain-containing radical SAM protein [Bacteriovoracaceae bacterium]|nr:twitch domain-containing radical SAM protein [Bacteriovoracaceae bacterium]
MSKVFCSIPWSHLQVDPNGDVRPCCIMQPMQNSVIGNINKTSLEEIWNSDGIKSLRKNLMTEKGDARCEICYRNEAVGGGSFRTNVENNMVKSFSRVGEVIQSTQADGSCEEVNLEYWDFRFSNYCNFKCRTCNPSYSTSWLEDAKAMGQYIPDQGGWKNNSEGRVKLIESYADKVKEIYFAGGEPLIMEEHLKVLNLLKDKKRFDVKLRYNSNLSTLNFKGNDFVNDFWKQFKDVVISGSLDAVGEKSEYIRSGTNWTQLDRNIRRLVDGKFNLNFNITVSSLNVFYLDEIVEYFISVGHIKPNKHEPHRSYGFIYNVVHFPEFYRVEHMPDAAKKFCYNKLKTYEESFQKRFEVKYTLFDEVFNALNAKSNPAMFEDFKLYTIQLDKLRAESVSKTLPELSQFFD